MAKNWLITGLLTHSEAVHACNELMEDPSVEDPDCLEVGCYITKDKEMRFGVMQLDPEDCA